MKINKNGKSIREIFHHRGILINLELSSSRPNFAILHLCWYSLLRDQIVYFSYNISDIKIIAKKIQSDWKLYIEFLQWIQNLRNITCSWQRWAAGTGKNERNYKEEVIYNVTLEHLCWRQDSYIYEQILADQNHNH